MSSLGLVFASSVRVSDIVYDGGEALQILSILPVKNKFIVFEVCVGNLVKRRTFRSDETVWRSSPI